MKKKSIISLLICCMTMGMVNTSCQDMLTPDSERHAYEVAQDTLYSYWGILKSLQNVAERYVILNECRGDLVDGTSYVSDTIAAIINFGIGYEDKYKDGACAYLKVSDYYHVINSCNAYIAKCDTAKMVSTGQQKRYMLQECAQVHAIRAWVYMQLIYAYGKVPFYKEPLLTTDDINNFITDPKHQMADAKTLADLLGPDLEEIYAKLDPEDMFPQYNNYGNVNSGSSSYVCHSMRTMFPLDVVIGDLYLMQGDEIACGKAASYYYKFLNSKFCGPLETTDYISLGDRVATIDEAQYGNYGNVPYNERGHSLTGGRYRREAITCIPSNKGRLDGMVFTDINRLFGFEATLSASGSGDESSSNVSLNFRDNGYRRELIPSKGYEALCDSQKYECYIGSGSNIDDACQELVVLPGVGDARRVWIYNTRSRSSEFMPRSEQYTLPKGEDTQYGKLVSKQNPGGSFSTVYPLVYRKATIWLRFAEAINRAGFPSYAFAILKNGLVSNHRMWFPSDVQEEDFMSSPFSYLTGARGLDYGVKDSVFVYLETVNDSTSLVWGLPDYDPDVTEYITSFEDLKTYVEAKYQAEADAINDTITEGDPVEPKTIDLSNVGFFALTFNNYPSEACLKALWYLDRREVHKAASTEYLNFNNRPYLRGYSGSMNLFYKRSIYDNRGYSTSSRYILSNSDEASDYLTIGVHQRGCGILKPDDPERWSSYDYVKLVTKKIQENHPEITTVTKEQIYDGSIQDLVIEAVEDLIIDEDGLELAFEGSRFSDLARVAIRRNAPAFLASRVAKRKGTLDTNLYNYLLNENHWYLPFPTE